MKFPRSPNRRFRKNWARLIQKIYYVDPLLCSKCLGSMKIISIIEDNEIIEKILRHFGLWTVHISLNSSAIIRTCPVKLHECSNYVLNLALIVSRKYCPNLIKLFNRGSRLPPTDYMKCLRRSLHTSLIFCILTHIISKFLSLLCYLNSVSS